MGEFDLVEPILDSVNSTGGGWPVLVLVLVIGAIVYLARYVLSRQIRINEQRIEEQEKLLEQRIADRKVEFEAQLERERNNTRSYQDTTDRMVDAFNRNATATSDFTAVLRGMAETLGRIDRNMEMASRSSRGESYGN